ncbi:thioredoxin family protein [Serinibacter arcticus]|uniref:thioredoxin family protein n=1 Tax=Serinibacter arcticus TaxID=1655435 RepID=UPI0011B1D736|nr:thioredoxin family protein [Serinibacter arcticus]
MDGVGVVVLVGAVVLALGVALWRRRRDGRVVPTSRPGAVAVPGLADDGIPVVLQLSSEVCAPCRAARRLLTDLVAGRDDVAHVDLDVAEHPGLVRELDVLRTPTVLLLDGDRRVRFRVAGVPDRSALVAALDDLAPRAGPRPPPPPAPAPARPPAPPPAPPPARARVHPRRRTDRWPAPPRSTPAARGSLPRSPRSCSR